MVIPKLVGQMNPKMDFQIGNPVTKPNEERPQLSAGVLVYWVLRNVGLGAAYHLHRFAHAQAFLSLGSGLS